MVNLAEVVHAFKPGGKAFPPMPVRTRARTTLEGANMRKSDKPEADASGRTQAGGASAAAGGLDLSLGHLGTHHVERRWDALCGACNWSLVDRDYKAAEDQAGSLADPACPKCGKRAWSFHLAPDQVTGQ